MNPIKAYLLVMAIVVIIFVPLGYIAYKGESNIDKATFHSACLKAGYSVDECEFEWIKEGR